MLALPSVARPEAIALCSSNESSGGRANPPAGAAAAAARALTTSRGTSTALPSRSISIISFGVIRDLLPRLRRTERVDLGPAHDVKPLSVGDAGRERAVGIRPDLFSRERVEPVGPPLESGEIDDAVDNRRRARDGA